MSSPKITCKICNKQGKLTRFACDLADCAIMTEQFKRRVHIKSISFTELKKETYEDNKVNCISTIDPKNASTYSSQDYPSEWWGM